MAKHRATKPRKWMTGAAVAAMLAGTAAWAGLTGGSPAEQATPAPAVTVTASATPTPAATTAPPAPTTAPPTTPPAPAATTARQPAPPAAPPNTSKAAAVVAVALAQRGKPYVFAAEGPSAFDCSGLVVYAYRTAAGITLPHFTGTLWSAGRVVATRAALLPGDLIFPATSHVQIYIGQGQVVDAANPGEPVKVRPLGTYLRAVRIL